MLVVLQTHVLFERDRDGKIHIKIEKKPTRDSLLKDLVQKLFWFCRTSKAATLTRMRRAWRRLPRRSAISPRITARPATSWWTIRRMASPDRSDSTC
jgi:hypothetical protein